MKLIPSAKTTEVIRGEVDRAPASRGVEGPAVLLGAGRSLSTKAKTVILSEVPRNVSPRETQSKHPLLGLRYLNLVKLFASAFALSLPLTATNIPAQSPDTTQLTQANEALINHDYPTALKLLTTLAAANPHDAHILFDLGLTEDNLDHVAEAETAYRAASAAAPQYAAPHLALGLLLARHNKVPEARTELLAAANIPSSPGDAEAPDITARALRALAKIDLATNAADARDELLFALKLSPETPSDIQISAQIAESLGDLALAETAYTRLLALTPDDPATNAALAHVLIRQHKIPEAESILAKALAADPGDTPLTAQLASAYLADDDPAKSSLAVPLAETLHQQHPEEASVTRLLARLYAQTKQAAKADPLYVYLLQQTPNDPTLLDDYGSNLIHLARFAEAESVLQRAVANPAAFPTTEDLAAAYNDLAFSASENKDATMTLQALDLRAKVAPSTTGSIFLAATAHDRLHQYKQASELYKQFLDLIKVTANGRFADQEWEARHRLIALQSMK